MIWIDSSFAVEWLLGTARAGRITLPSEPLGILPSQYAESFVFFLKQGYDPSKISNELESLELRSPEKIHLQVASQLYRRARINPKSKVSLADAILAGMIHVNRERLVAFDEDFSDLGLRKKNGIWSLAS